MIIEQTIEIPENRRITIEIPKEVPIGNARLLIQFPIREDVQTDIIVPPEGKGQINNDAFRNALRRAYGVWKDKPWVNHHEDINAMRNEWDHRDPWNSDTTEKH